MSATAVNPTLRAYWITWLSDPFSGKATPSQPLPDGRGVGKPGFPTTYSNRRALLEA